MAEIAPLLSVVLGNLQKLIWPLFIWFFTGRPDVRRHIGVVFRIIEQRLESLELGSLKVKLLQAEPVAPQPSEERENDLENSPRPLPESENENESAGPPFLVPPRSPTDK
jgi:hypothetical protein